MSEAVEPAGTQTEVATASEAEAPTPAATALLINKEAEATGTEVHTADHPTVQAVLLPHRA